MHEWIRKALIITLCLVLSKVLHLDVGVFLVLYGIIIGISCPVNSLPVMIRMLVPSVLAAAAAICFNQIFSAHPFIIWTLSVVLFDYVRKNADNSFKAKTALMPLFHVIFINTYASSADFVMAVPEIVRDLLISMFLAVIITYLVNLILPIRVSGASRGIVKLPVTGADRLKMFLLVGGGLAVLMVNEMTSATFCLVPVITSVMQPTSGHMKNEAAKRIMTQVGGCSGAMLLSVLFMGTEINIVTYVLVSFALVLTLMKWCESADPVVRSMHSDAVTGILIPFQLYMGKYGNSFGLDLIALRAFELVIALGIVYFVATLLERNNFVRT